MLHDLYRWLTQQSFLSISLARWLGAALITIVGFALVMGINAIVVRRLRRFSGQWLSTPRAMLLAALDRTTGWLVLLLFAVIGTQTLNLPEKTARWLGYLGAVVAALQIGLWLGSAIGAWTRSRLSEDTGQPHNPVVMGMLGWFLRIMVWATLLLAALSFMGINITAFVASLGVGGVAVALALQSVLGDLFASMSIGLDKPFEIGQFITFDTIAGNIEHVGVKTTRIRSISGEQIVISNSELLKNTLHNFARMNERRVLFAFGVTYDTAIAALRDLPEVLRGIIEGTGNARFDRAHFKSFGDSSLDYEVVYHVTGAEYGLYMDTQQAINLALMEHCASHGIDFAFPSRTLYVAGTVQTRLQGTVQPAADPHGAAPASQPAT